MINENRVAAGIVLYNPSNRKRLLDCMESVLSQVDSVYVIDNSEEAINLPYDEKIIHKFNGCNKGVASALNQIMTLAEKDGFQWVISMDQDSILPRGMVDDFKQYFNHKNIGIVCPQLIDKRRSYMTIENKLSEENINMCITSASCTSVNAWKQIGKFDEYLFIDLVDNDFCKRLILSGYKILRLNQWVLDQEFGDITPKPEKSQKFWLKVSKILHNENFAKFSYKKIVHSNRVYFTCRNIVYLNKKFKLYNGIGYKDNYNCNTFLGFLVCFVAPSILRSNEKMKTVQAVVSGFKDGKNCEVIPWKSATNNQEEQLI